MDTCREMPDSLTNNTRGPNNSSIEENHHTGKVRSLDTCVRKQVLSSVQGWRHHRTATLRQVQ